MDTANDLERALEERLPRILVAERKPDREQLARDACDLLRRYDAAVRSGDVEALEAAGQLLEDFANLANAVHENANAYAPWAYRAIAAIVPRRKHRMKILGAAAATRDAKATKRRPE